MTNISIFEAAASGDIEYIKKNTKALTDKNERGWTPLHFAARFGKTDIATFIKNFNPQLLTVLNNENKTAAQIAQFWRYDDLAKLLTPTSPKEESSVNENVPSKDFFSQNINHVNFFAGNPLNRYGWYRTKKEELSRLLYASNAKFILFSKLDSLFNENNELYLANFDQVSTLINKDQFKSSTDTELDYPTLIFLGIDENNKEDNGVPEGTPYWALDVTLKPSPLDKELSKFHEDLEKLPSLFSSAMPQAYQLHKKQASILAQARSMMDWHTRNKFCPACGNKVKSSEAGHKLLCTNTNDCVSHKGIHNFAYPRTDAVVIVCIVHPTEDKILLGRNKSWPARMFSCIAGFVEAGESIEEAVKREALEETGIIVDQVHYHSTQPWPFPNSLMFGFIALAKTTDIKMEDKELESARWFSRSEVLGALKNQGVFNVPPKFAIAHQLIESWANEKTYRRAKM